MMHDDTDSEFFDILRTELSEPVEHRCECKCNGLEPHANEPCAKPATVFVALHRYGFCTDPPDSEGYRNPENVDADGNITSMMCQACADHAYWVAMRRIKELRMSLPHHMIPYCPTCGRPMSTAEDLVERKAI